MKAVGYLRVSQSDENVENQLMVIRGFCERRGLELVGVFRDVDVSGSVPPRKRDGYRSMLKFCEDNGIKIIIFYDLSRLARDVIEGLNELKKLTEEGYNVYFAGMDFLNYDIDPMLKKKIIMDFLWFAELYLEDVKKRTRVAMERLKREGRVYHRPRLAHYVALWMSGKESFGELTRDDIERGERYLFEYIKERLAYGESLRSIHDGFIKEHIYLYKELRAPRSYLAFWREWKRLKEKYGRRNGKWAR